MRKSDYLKGLGAASVIDRNEFDTPGQAARQDALGGGRRRSRLGDARQCLVADNPEGTVAACGLAQGMDLPTSVAPFILRGVKLIGVNSVTCPKPRRIEAWRRLAIDLDLGKLRGLSRHVKLEDVPQIAADIVAGKIRGRVVVDL